MSNAAKHRKKAAEFEQLKQIDRAIASYIKAIDESEEGGEDVDVALLNKVGDLTLRQGRVADAVTYYERAVEHYASSGLFNNAIALCNKILRSSPGRAKVYFTLGRICATKGLRGDATRNFLEYATRMQQEGRVDEGMRALAEVANLMPELTEVRRMVEEHAERAGIVLDRRKTPMLAAVLVPDPAFPNRVNKSSELVFLDTGDPHMARRHTPPLAPRIRVGVTPAMVKGEAKAEADATRRTPAAAPSAGPQSAIDAFLLFDPRRPGAVTPPGVIKAVAEMPIDDALPTADDARDETQREIEAVVDLFVEAPEERTNDDAIEDAKDDAANDAGNHVAADDTNEAHAEREDAFGNIEPVYLEADGSDDDTVDQALRDAVRDVEEQALSHEAAPIFESILDPEPVLTTETLEGLVFEDTLRPDDDEVSPPSLTFLVEREAATNDAMADHGALQNAPNDTLTWLTPDDADDLSFASDLAVMRESGDENGPPLEFLAIDELPDGTLLDGTRLDETLPDLVVEDFDHVADDANAIIVTGGRPGTPAYGVTPVGSLTPIDVSRIPEIEEAIEAGALAAARAEADPEMALRRPPVRFDPHNFILPGELPPLAVDDEFMDLGLAGAQAAEHEAAVPEEDQLHAAASVTASVTASENQPADAEASDADFGPLVTPVFAMDESIAAVAAEANVVATSRRAELQAAVDYAPQDFALRRRLAEALFEVGSREHGLSELQFALSGFAQAGDLSAAAEIADELVRISPDRIQYHQKRVELAVRLSDQALLRLAYLDLADTLVRIGDDVRAHAVYARVLEIDPWDERARSALGAAAPPPPPPPTADDEFIDFAAFLQDGETASTRMRMREPEVSGNEQADFDSLLRHFKEGVARSLEEEDYESHYDLGVAYKEMGLLDDAIAEFQKALRSRRHRLPAYEALGQCFVEQSRHSVAATVLTRALHEPGLGDEQRIGVLYLLAYSCEALQRWKEARSYYSRVYATDINFRDAAARLAALEQIAQ